VPARRANAGILSAARVAGLLVCPAARAWEARVFEATVNDLAWDPFSKRLYASIPSWGDCVRLGSKREGYQCVAG